MIVTLDHDVYDSEGNLLLAKGYAVDLSEENRDRLGRLGIRQEENQPQANGQKQNVEEYGINTLRSAPSKTPEGPKIVLNSFVAKLIENKLSLEQAWFQEAYSVVEDSIYGYRTSNWYPYISTMINYVDWLYSHSINTALISCLLGSKMKYSAQRLKELTFGALLHDIGMTLLPKAVLNKPTKLTDAEMIIVRNHCEMGHSMILDTELPTVSKQIILQHHEKNDGSGYPYGLTKANILEDAQIVAIAEDFDTATATRPYKKAKPVQEVLSEMSLKPEIYDSNLIHILSEHLL